MIQLNPKLDKRITELEKQSDLLLTEEIRALPLVNKNWINYRDTENVHYTFEDSGGW